TISTSTVLIVHRSARIAHLVTLCGPGAAAGSPQPPHQKPAVPSQTVPRSSAKRHHRRQAEALQQLAQRCDEALVLGVGADRDPQPPFAAERRAGANQHAALAQLRDDLALVGVIREAQPDEVRVRLRDPQAELAYAVLEPHPQCKRALDAAIDLVLV